METRQAENFLNISAGFIKNGFPVKDGGYSFWERGLNKKVVLDGVPVNASTVTFRENKGYANFENIAVQGKSADIVEEITLNFTYGKKDQRMIFRSLRVGGNLALSHILSLESRKSDDPDGSWSEEWQEVIAEPKFGPVVKLQNSEPMQRDSRMALFYQFVEAAGGQPLDTTIKTIEEKAQGAELRKTLKATENTGLNVRIIGAENQNEPLVEVTGLSKYVETKEAQKIIAENIKLLNTARNMGIKNPEEILYDLLKSPPVIINPDDYLNLIKPGAEFSESVATLADREITIELLLRKLADKKESESEKGFKELREFAYRMLTTFGIKTTLNVCRELSNFSGRLK
jgi:hypothetical protein